MTTLAQQEQEAQQRLAALQQKLLAEFTAETDKKAKKTQQSFEDEITRSLEKLLTSQLRTVAKSQVSGDGSLEDLLAASVGGAGSGLFKNGKLNISALLNGAAKASVPFISDLFGGETGGQTLGLSRSQSAAANVQFLQGGNRNL